MTKKDPKVRILDIFVKLIKEKKMTPSRLELKEAGVSKDQYQKYFGSIVKLKEAARIYRPEAFTNLIDETVFTPKNVRKLKGEVKNFERFVVTTAVTGMTVHKPFYKNLLYYCKLNNAKLLILPSTDPAASAGFELDGVLANESLVLQELELNSNLMISTFKTSAKQINPLTGLRRMGRRERSMIVASPKQFLEYVPIANDSMSHALMTTGAITRPQYHTDRYMSLRTAYIAEMDHKMGAVIVEIVDNKKFHFRQIQAEYGTGYFIDNGIYYKGNKTATVRPEALTLGDIHVGSLKQSVIESTDNMIKQLRPKRVFLHDLFDGISCNPHASAQYLTKAKFSIKQLSIEEELRDVKTYLEDMKKKHPCVEEWIVVRSNHDIFLDRFLDSGEYIKDPINSRICHKLASMKLDGEIPLKAGLSLVGTNFAKITFLHLNDSYKINGIEHGQHGHLGMNGQRNPQNSSLEIAYGAGVFGHSHTAGILREIFRTGTSTEMRLGYNNGASSWTNTHCATYANGSRQLLNDINGEWRKV